MTTKRVVPEALQFLTKLLNSAVPTTDAALLPRTSIQSPVEESETRLTDWVVCVSQDNG